tara:strand:+ start:1059 stop:1214 length:156 start_codon:yes stop_codon:yes gene_type:complete
MILEFKIYEIDKNTILKDKIILFIEVSDFVLIYVKETNDKVIKRLTFLKDV